jgi:CDP-diacylglycerol pyrophosphatase
VKIKRVLLSAIVLIGISCQSLNAANRSDALWHIINKECVPNQKKYNQPAPCSEVSYKENSEQGYVVFKDRRGPLQYLLMPLTKVTGIEDSQIIKSDAVNYFYEAWKAKSYMISMYQAPIPDEEISLAINSKRGRSQNQLHIHISCIRPDVKKLVYANSAAIGDTWALFPGGILNHPYYARRLPIEQLAVKNPFILLNNDFPAAKENMKDFTMALIVENNNFIIIVDRFSAKDNNWAWAEEIQDHNCPQLKF